MKAGGKYCLDCSGSPVMSKGHFLCYLSLERMRRLPPALGESLLGKEEKSIRKNVVEIEMPDGQKLMVAYVASGLTLCTGGRPSYDNFRFSSFSPPFIASPFCASDGDVTSLTASSSRALEDVAEADGRIEDVADGLRRKDEGR